MADSDGQLFPFFLALAKNIHASLDVREIATRTIQGLAGVLKHAAAFTLYTYNDERDVLQLQGKKGLTAEFVGKGVLQPGEGLAGIIAATQCSLFSDILSGNAVVDIKKLKGANLFSFAGIPLTAGTRLVGVLELYSSIPESFPSEDQTLLQEAGQIIGQALANAREYEKMSERASRIVGVGRGVTVSRQLGTIEEVLQDVSKVLVHSLGFSKAWIGLYDSGNKKVTGVAGFGEEVNKKQIRCEFFADSASTVLGSIREKQQSLVLMSLPSQKDAEEFVRWLWELGEKNIIISPVSAGDELLGVIVAVASAEKSIGEEDVKALESVAEQTAIAVENARLYERLTQSEKSYRSLFESAGTSLVIIDQEGEFMLVNQAFQELCGLEAEDLYKNGKFADFIIIDQEDETRLNKLVFEPPQSWEGQFKNNSGEIRQVHFTTTSIPESEQVLVSLINMTRERELERRLYRSEELAAIGELSAGIAHEIRNPLVAITTSVNLLRDEPNLSSEGQELLDVVKEESDHLAVIVEDFLRFARPKKPNLREANINKLLTDVIKRMDDFKTSEVKLKSRFDTNLPMVEIDRHQIQQVITNLIVNSIEASSPGSTITITSSLERAGEEKRVKICVQDRGAGIDKEAIGKIFQPFFSTKDKGTGMGLSICQRIIDGHQGEIRVESEPDKGTTFSVFVPVTKES